MMMKQKPTYEELEKQFNNLKQSTEILRQNEARLESLLALSQMEDVTEEEIREFALESVVALTYSKGGYLHFYNEDNRTIDLVSWSKDVHKICTAEKSQHYPLNKAGIWADSVRLRKPVVHNDYQNLENQGGLPEGHFPLYRHLSIPIFDQDRIIAITGVGNKEEPYHDEDVRQSTLFMNSMWAILKQKKAEEIIKRYSMENGLTGLANRRRFDEVISIEWRRAYRNKTPLSVIMADIDFFKAYNDTYGHHKGDECLKKVGTCLRKSIRRAGDLVARYGGEEFVVVLPETSLQGSFIIAESIRQSVYEMNIPHEGSEKHDFVSMSAGVASSIPSDGITCIDLICLADKQLYRAKHAGRNCVKGAELSITAAI